MRGKRSGIYKCSYNTGIEHGVRVEELKDIDSLIPFVKRMKESYQVLNASLKLKHVQVTSDFTKMNYFEERDYSIFLWSQRVPGDSYYNLSADQSGSCRLYALAEMVMPSLIYNFKMKRFDNLKLYTTKYYNLGDQDSFPCINFTDETQLFRISKMLEIGCAVDLVHEGLMFISTSGNFYDRVVEKSGVDPQNIIAYIFFEVQGVVTGQLIHIP